MNWKKHIIHGLVAGVLSAIASIIYLNIYRNAFDVDYSAIVQPVGIFASCIFGCTLMAIGYALLERFDYQRFTGVLNILISVLSFAFIVGAIGATLPLDTANPELFPGLVVPMHFFPALAFFTIIPFFNKISNNN